MKLQNDLNQIYEQSRLLLLQTEPLIGQIKKISHPQLKERLCEIMQTCQADLLVLNDVVIDSMNCESESDIELILG